jgi:hypothetical protein
MLAEIYMLGWNGSTGGNGSGRHQLGVAVRPDHLAGCENMKLSVRYFNGYFLVTGPDTEPAKFKTRQQALSWCAAHYPDLPIKEHRPGGKRLAANKTKADEHSNDR